MHRHRRVAHARNMNRVMLNGSDLVAVHFQVGLAHDGASGRVLVLYDVSGTGLKRQPREI